MKIIKHRKQLIGLIFFIIISMETHASKNQFLRIEGEKIMGLSEAYQPAEFNVAEGRLRVKDHVVCFSSYIKSLYNRDPCELEYLTTPGGLQLIIRIKPEGRDYSYDLMVNLNNLEIFGLFIEIEGDGYTRMFKIMLPEENTRRGHPLEVPVKHKIPLHSAE